MREGQGGQPLDSAAPTQASQVWRGHSVLSTWIVEGLENGLWLGGGGGRTAGPLSPQSLAQAVSAQPVSGQPGELSVCNRTEEVALRIVLRV